jgi:aminopeptidase N
MIFSKYKKSIFLLIGSFYCIPSVQADELNQKRSFDVLKYSAEIQPNMADKTLNGHEAIQIKILNAGLKNIQFDIDGLNIASVSEHGKALNFSTQEKKLQIQLPRVAVKGEKYSFDIQYVAKPDYGMQFYPEREEIYTIFATSQWLVVIDAPDERASLDLRIRLPRNYKTVGNGKLLFIKSSDQSTETHHWQQKIPVPSYVYGFAASKCQEAIDQSNGVKLRYLSRDYTPEHLKQIFVDTSDMLQFFSQRSGIPYRGDYTQALVADTIGQEMAGFALMSEAYGAEILKDPTKKGLMAHEIAHQWWGNQVTCRDWNHFWLNEGFASFMAAAYLQHRFGEDAYSAQVDRWQKRIEKLRTEGKDHGLVYDEWLKPSNDDRAVVYQKGAYALHQLRLELGEKVFWQSIQAYTQQYYGKSVTTDEFKDAIEKASGRDLSAFFSKWIDAPVVVTESKNASAIKSE